uniref:Uncharacterized protein n=1 Tax=Cyprinus carpio TaxID=7962 RepID=A0A8C2BYM9_CYPCA
MDEYHYPIIVEGNWESEHVKSVKNKLQIHFQSKKKSQGGDCVVKYNDKSNSATVLFKSSHSKFAFTTDPEEKMNGGLTETNAVVLENLPEDVKQDVLTLLVENISRLPENDFSMELIPELRKAVVTFKNTNEKFLQDSRTHEKFKQYNLRACGLERSTCVRVENLPAEANNNKMLLELYFEKWGGPVEEVITIPSEQAAILIFKEEEEFLRSVDCDE